METIIVGEFAQMPVPVIPPSSYVATGLELVLMLALIAALWLLVLNGGYFKRPDRRP